MSTKGKVLQVDPSSLSDVLIGWSRRGSRDLCPQCKDR